MHHLHVLKLTFVADSMKRHSIGVRDTKRATIRLWFDFDFCDFCPPRNIALVRKQSETPKLHEITVSISSRIQDKTRIVNLHTLRDDSALLIISAYLGWSLGFLAFADPPARFLVAFAGAAGAAAASDIFDMMSC